MKRDDGVAMASTGPYSNHLYFTPADNYARTSSLNFYRPDTLPDAQLSVKALKE